MDSTNPWDERFGAPHFVYGTAPNDFLVSVVNRLPAGRALCLAEGEGRNAVFLAEQGFDVTAVDASAVGLQKAERLAADRGTSIRTIVSDLSHYEIAPETWDVIVLIFAHVAPELRRRVHAAAAGGLKPGGALVLEAYTPAQLALKTGGPPVVDLMMRLNDLEFEFRGLDFAIGRELQREIHEGTLHNGVSAVVQVLAFRPDTR